MHKKISSPTSDALDRAGGVVLGVALSLTLVWVIATFVNGAPLLAALQPDLQESKILQGLSKGMPSQLITQAVSRLDPIPRFRGPEANVDEPNAAIVQDPEVLAATSRVVRVSGVACGLGVEGSGWVAAPDLIVTNAHVVAGEITTQIQPDGTGLPVPAKVVVFDDKNDIAVLRVQDLRLPPLSIAEPESNEPVAILGFPQNGPLDTRAGRVGQTLRVISGDAYNRGPVERTVTSFRGFVRPGNSGGPAVNADGAVVATVFASRADSDNAGYGVPSNLVQQHIDLAKQHQNPVDTKECAS